jgi:hypothetical protein
MNRESLFELDDTALGQRSHVRDRTWDGASLVELRGKIGELYTQIPIFRRQLFRSGGEENRYKDRSGANL